MEEPKEYKEYEEERIVSPFMAWVILLLISGVLLGWGMAIMFTVRDVPRQWNFGQLPDTPAESVYSTRTYEGGYFPRVIPMLPGADLKKASDYSKKLAEHKGLERAGD